MRTENERIVRPRDNFERAREAMRSLLTVAKAKLETGAGGGLPVKEIHEAKDYFFEWRRRKPFSHNKLFFFFVTAIFVFFFHPQNLGDLVIFSGGIGVIWGGYVMLETDKMRKVYIIEMLGNLAHMSKDEADLYVSGLLYDLWRIEGEGVRWRYGLSLFAGMILAASIAAFSPEEDEIITGVKVGLFFIFSIAFFVPQIIFAKKVEI